ncbi:MAG: GMP/IMP nucleotidase [Proteobacteria bacterium]|jgi:HAD superfamily hydrolase (TIGR01509 family)|nr:GMP/IMP nucleotidase [Pseudomonadota bacterium]MBK7116974.1 GMP/IMP nucleotidase [Pseudomonadota bacterium]MBK9250757.1 GMP/IMP nucleotidase [Pseudomonadota bacterium]
MHPLRLPDHIRTLLLDLDGTLLDLAFDTHFWLEVVPEYYGRERGLTAERALREQIQPRLRAAEGTLNWYCLDYWSRMLELDLSAIKSRHDERIAWLPGAQEFLARQRAAGRRLVLATNSHPETLRIKDEKVAVRAHLDAMFSSHQFGAPKEHAEFWLRLAAVEPFDPAHTAFIDDNPKVLQAARAAGIACVIAVTNPDSSRPPRAPPEGFAHVAAVADIL